MLVSSGLSTSRMGNQMNDHTQLTVDPGAVSAAGRRTAATSEQWEIWVRQCANVFEETGQALHSVRVELASGELGFRIVTASRQLAWNVAGLGSQTVQASSVVEEADEQAAQLLGQQPGPDPSALSRPINAVPI